ncbi:hypothetical protein [Mesorhizobium sp. LSHC420B00]|uniref:hypothetical protein n=1 Tax=Mesorhizobium sp. LSHC420B00 TaxID=1287292 RepID=UPI0012EBC23F|nr:hypothetical protein [Mesorhizobium sp. LSHC420B00]
MIETPPIPRIDWLPVAIVDDRVVVRITDAHCGIGRIEGWKDVRRRGCRTSGN